MKSKLKTIGLLMLLLLAVVAVANAAPNAQQGDELSVTGGVTLGGDIQVVEPKDATGPGRYIVQLEDDALATYQGGIAGLEATSPMASGDTELDLNSEASVAYLNYLEKEQVAFLSATANALDRSVEPVYQYKHALNGVVLVLTPEEAAAVAKLPGVKHIERDVAQSLTTDAGPAWIGAPSIWDGSAVPGMDGTQGEGVIVGIVDSGINMDHPSFAATGGDGYTHTNPFGDGNYVGWCDPANPNYDPAYVCNSKLVGAWDYADASWAGTPDEENDGPEDNDGHGSHTASTTAGNVVEATLYAPTTSVTDTISGVAPHANIIAYDVCAVSCFTSDSVAAVNQAVMDGVDVLNESISIGGDVFTGSKQQAYLGAYAAGMVVVRSAGNSGPAASTVGPEPVWTLSVAASTHNRQFINAVTDMSSDGASLADIEGLGFTAGYGPAPILYAGALGDYDGDGNDDSNALCGLGDQLTFQSPWPEDFFNGEIIVCDRGTYGRVEKGANVAFSGGGGYVLANDEASGGSLVGDAHALPGVHITYEDGVVLKDWIANNDNTTATIAGVTADTAASNGDIMASFSSRGPGEVNVIKPDISAPGVDIWAAVNNDDGVTPDGEPEYGFLSGTSMSSPHTAGAAALMKALHPTWSPAEIRSALMTTASVANMVKEDGTTPADPFDMGGGRVDLTQAGQAGLVLDINTVDFILADPAVGGEPMDLNLATMQNDDCYQSCGWSRTVTNPTTMSMTWEATYEGPGQAMVSPASFTVTPNQSATFDFDLDVLTLDPEQWYFGRVVWSETSGKAPDVAMPVAFYVKASTDADALTKTADKSVATPGELVEYTITIQNTETAARSFQLLDPLPENAEYVEGSASEGLEYMEYPDGSALLTWEGNLDPSGISLSPAGITGYIGLAGLGVTPFDLPSNCDDGGFLIGGLDFTYLGESYDNVIWSVNGTLEPGAASGAAASASNTALPNPAAPNNLLAPWWTDLNLCDAGNWYVAGLTDGTNDFTVFEWENVPRFDDLDSRATFQVWIQDGTDAIWFAYPENAFTGDTGDGTIGVENADGSAGAQLYFDGTGTLPDGSSDYAVEFFQSEPVTLSFQVRANGEVLNEARVSNGVVTNRAYAYTGVEGYVSYLPAVPIDGSLPALPTIAEIVASDDNFSTLLTAVEAAGLVDALNSQGPYTVFAPTNDAFDALPDGVLDDLLADPQGALRNVLLYHAAPGAFFAEDVAMMESITTLLGPDITVEVQNGNVILNGEVMVTDTDIQASNGVVHVIDAVLIPPMPTIADLVTNEPNFSTLATALEVAGLTDALAQPGPYTVFAPPNSAFDALPEGVLDDLLANPDQLSEVLLYHVADGSYPASEVVQLDAITTLQGEDITIEVTEGGDVILNGDTNLLQPDVVASNGIIHVIDQVLIPPSMMP